MTASYDVAVVGAGIIGLAHAYHFARRGLRVIVLERHPRAQGASIRNFGMIWPIGQPLGPYFELARRSADIWSEVLTASDIWHRRCGSMHLAYHDDEAQVLSEYIGQAQANGVVYALWTPSQIRQRLPAVVENQLKAGLWSPTEIVVDPRQVVRQLPDWLHRTLNVDFAFATTVLGFDLPHIRTTQGDLRVQRLVIAAGADYRDLAPSAFAESGLVPVKLQMMRSQPFGGQFSIDMHLAAGLTLRHYAAFADCPTLPQLVNRLDENHPEYGRFGIHVMVSQNELGELTIGDSHQYGADIEPFDQPHIDEIILGYLRSFLDVPGLRIATRWHGIYIKHPTLPFVVKELKPNAWAVAGVGGAGMTLSFGLAENNVANWIGPRT